MIDEKDFEDWLSQKITQDFIMKLREKAQDCKAAWSIASWDNENPDPAILIKLKASEQMLLQVADVSHEDIYD